MNKFYTSSFKYPRLDTLFPTPSFFCMQQHQQKFKPFGTFSNQAGTRLPIGRNLPPDLDRVYVPAKNNWGQTLLSPYVPSRLQLVLWCVILGSAQGLLKQ